MLLARLFLDARLYDTEVLECISHETLQNHNSYLSSYLYNYQTLYNEYSSSSFRSCNRSGIKRSSAGMGHPIDIDKLFSVGGSKREAQK